jgi:hypothetical protein
MSTLAILPVSSIDFGNSSASASQQSVFNSLLNQLQQAVGNGDLTTSATLLNAIDALSPSSAASSSPLGAFLTSLGTALNDGSVSEAQSALTTYQSATPTTTTSAAPSTVNANASAASIAAGLVQSQIQFNLVTALLGPNASLGTNASSSDSSSSSSNSVSSLIAILNAAYGAGSSSSSGATGSTASASGSSGTTNATSSSTPYDALVSSIQANLGAGQGTITPALAYLQASGNFVNTAV